MIYGRTALFIFHLVLPQCREISEMVKRVWQRGMWAGGLIPRCVSGVVFRTMDEFLVT